MPDCSIFYKNGKLLPWDELPYWYVQFLASSPPDKETEKLARQEMNRRGYRNYIRDFEGV
jgi:hypothetical protein